MKTTKVVLAITATILIAADAHAGRWLSRDPIQEGAGFVQREPRRELDFTQLQQRAEPNPYMFVRNNPVDLIDPFGLMTIDPKKRTIEVGKCEVVILFGHGSKKKPWTWNVQSGCNAAGGITCWPVSNSQGIPDDKNLWPKIPDDNPLVIWGPVTVDPNQTDRAIGGNLLADPVFDKIYLNAYKISHDLCKKKCCDTVTVYFVWHAANADTVINNPKNSETDYQGKFTIQNYQWDCKSNTRRLIPR